MFEDLLVEGSSGRRVASFDAGHHIWMSSSLNVFMFECLHVWMSSWWKSSWWPGMLKVFVTLCWFLKNLGPAFFSSRLHWFVIDRYRRYIAVPITNLIDPDCTVVDMNTSSTLASHWNGRTEGRTVRPDDPCADSILKLPHFPCPNSLGGTACWDIGYPHIAI